MFNADLQFDVSPVKTFKYVRGSIQNVRMRKAMNKAAASTKRKAAQLAPKDRHHLERSLRIKVKYYKNKAVWVAMVGPGSKVKYPFPNQRGRKKEDKKFHQPSRYVHMVEFHQGHSFLRPALAATQQEFLSILRDEIDKAIKEGLR